MSERPDNALRRLSAWMCSPTGVLLTLAVGLVLLYLILAHRLHLLAALPYLVLLACPLLHLLHGHGRGRRHRGD